LTDCISIQDFDIKMLKNYNLIGIGGPTHFYGGSKSMKRFLSKLRHCRLENKRAFAFETKESFRLAGSAAKRIIRRLKKMKIKIIRPYITGIVLNKEGPLRDNTLSKMEKIGLDIAEQLN